MSVKDFVNKLKPKAQNCCSVEIEEKKSEERKIVKIKNSCRLIVMHS